MKKINKIRFSEKVDLLTESEMKSLTGGRGMCNPERCSGSCACVEFGSMGNCGWTNWPEGGSDCTCACAGIGW